jgi:hypothetical protein
MELSSLKSLYEIHITVNTNNIAEFKTICELEKIKPIILDLQDREGNTIFHDVMTSSKYTGTSPLTFANKLADKLKTHGLPISRIKIEATPYNDLVPTQSNKKNIELNCYFESHLRINTNIISLPLLKIICSKNNAHLSVNIFKTRNVGFSTFTPIQILATLRQNKGNYEEFLEQVYNFKVGLIDNDFNVDKTEIEYAIYDSNIDHDQHWIKNIS